MTILTEGLDYLDLEGMLGDMITVDEYVAKMGKDKDMVTLSFLAKSKMAADDLVTWFERGYDFILDASVSDGELEPGVYLVFVELLRRSVVPLRIMRLLSDLETLTGRSAAEWTIDVEGDEIPASEEGLRKLMVLNPNEYKLLKEPEEEINDIKQIAGLDTHKQNTTTDPDLQQMKATARI